MKKELGIVMSAVLGETHEYDESAKACIGDMWNVHLELGDIGQRSFDRTVERGK